MSKNSKSTKRSARGKATKGHVAHTHSESVVTHFREKAERAARLRAASSSEEGLQKISEFVQQDAWYATDTAFPAYAELITACRIAYGHVYLSKEALGAEPADLISQSGRWLLELYIYGMNLFRVEFLIHLGRRQIAPVRLGFRSATCYFGLSLNVAQRLAEILLNVWNGMPDRELNDTQIMTLDRDFHFTQAHIKRIRSRVILEFGFTYSTEVDRLFEDVRIGIQQERAVMAPVDVGVTTLTPRAKYLVDDEADEKRSWLVDSVSDKRRDIPTDHSIDYRSVKWYGASYSFTTIQAACIKILWEHWSQGTPTIGEQTILEAAGSASHRLRDVFGAQHPAWQTLIVPDGKGAFRLSDPKE